MILVQSPLQFFHPSLNTGPTAWFPKEGLLMDATSPVGSKSVKGRQSARGFICSSLGPNNAWQIVFI